MITEQEVEALKAKLAAAEKKASEDADMIRKATTINRALIAVRAKDQPLFDYIVKLSNGEDPEHPYKRSSSPAEPTQREDVDAGDPLARKMEQLDRRMEDMASAIGKAIAAKIAPIEEHIARMNWTSSLDSVRSEVGNQEFDGLRKRMQELAGELPGIENHPNAAKILYRVAASERSDAKRAEREAARKKSLDEIWSPEPKANGSVTPKVTSEMDMADLLQAAISADPSLMESPGTAGSEE